MRTFLSGLCLLLLASGLALAESEGSRFQRTAQALQAAEPELQARFANIALLELTEIYLAEADLARREAESAEEAGKLIAWSRAVSQYANGLALLLDDIEFGLPVELRLNSREVPSVSVGGRTVMLAHPRSRQQAGYEQTVLNLFCTGTTCTELTAREVDRQAIPVSPTIVSPNWMFTADGPRCDYRGLQVIFPAGGQLAVQKSLCQQLMQEVELLATELAWQQRHGVEVEWEHVQISSTPGRPEHLVTLNHAGDSLLITVPLMQSTPKLLQRVSPWLQGRFAENGPPPLQIDATTQGWD